MVRFPEVVYVCEYVSAEPVDARVIVSVVPSPQFTSKLPAADNKKDIVVFAFNADVVTLKPGLSQTATAAFDINTQHKAAKSAENIRFSRIVCPPFLFLYENRTKNSHTRARVFYIYIIYKLKKFAVMI